MYKSLFVDFLFCVPKSALTILRHTIPRLLYSFYDIYYKSKNNTYNNHGNNREVKVNILFFNPDIAGKLPEPFECVMKEIYNNAQDNKK